MQLITSIIGIAFVLYAFFNNPFDFAYLFIVFFFFVFATVFYMASDIIEIKEGIEENNRGLWSMDRKMDIILDKLKKVKKNATRKQK
jgi:hypothetical protein